MRVSNNKDHPDQLDIDLSTEELNRLVRGAEAESTGRYGPGINRIRIRNEGHSNVRDLDSMRFELSRMRRELAVEQSSQFNIPAEFPQSFAIVCPTVGDSTPRLFQLIKHLRQTDLHYPCAIVVADDGGGFESDKRTIATRLGCHYVPNLDRPGIPGNLNSAWKFIKQYDHLRHMVVVDDGALPHKMWLRELGKLLQVLDRNTVLVGSSHIQDWQLAMAGMLGNRWPVRDWMHRPDTAVDVMTEHFYRTFSTPHEVTKESLLNEFLSSSDCPNHEAVDYVRYNRSGEVDGDMHEFERVCRRCKYVMTDRWPNSKSELETNWSPGAQGLVIDLDFLERSGGFTHDCMGYEILLACKAAENGHAVCSWDGPPWIHFPSLGFVEVHAQKCSTRSHRDINTVCQETWGIPDPFDVVLKHAGNPQSS